MQADAVFLKRRSDQLYKIERLASARLTDRMFAVLLSLEWLAGIAIAAWWAPRLSSGRTATTTEELIAAALLGAAVVGPAILLCLQKSGSALTRHVVAASQMLWSALLIHLCGGRIEAHFHIFGSLAFLSLYRDWRVLVLATVVAGADQFLRGTYWSASIYGTSVGTPWRWLEHVGWMVFEDIFLIYRCINGDREMRGIVERQAELEDARTSVERAVNERTAQLTQSNRDLARQVGERQRIEQEIRAARDDLDMKVRDRTAELAAANRALKRQIEEGRRTSDELERSVQLYRFTSDSVPQIVWMAEPDGSVEYFNRRFHEYTGLAIEESTGWNWTPMLHPDDAERSLNDWQHSVQTGEVYEIEYRLRRGSDGAFRWHLGRALPMRAADGRIVKWFGTCTDIDDQKRAREVTTRSEQRYRSLVAASAQLVWLTNAEGEVTVDMPDWRTATGQSFEEMSGFGWLDCIHPDDRESAITLWHSSVHTGRFYEFEHRMRMQDGEYRHFSSRGVPVMESSGRVREWIGTSTDISERKQAEEVLRRAQEELEARVRDRTIQLTETNQILHQQVVERKQIEGELAEARDDALRSARLKSEFLANMSHEIRTPMNGVIGMTSLLLDTPLNEEQHEYVETIRGSSDALLTIINDILDFSKIEAGKLEFEEVDFDLQSTVEGAVELLAEKAQAKTLDLACHVLEDVPRLLRGDPGRLRQVLVNLVGNAVKFTLSGRVLVHVAKLAESVNDTQLCFQVSDTGIGLSEEAARGLFQAFVQADGSTTRKFGGTGLGLAISRQLVELMDGKIGVESAPGQGSTFWFTVRLPKQPVVLADEEVSPEPTINFSAAHTLIVGATGTGEVLREQLSSWGMKTLVLTQALDALQALRAAVDAGKPYGFVIVDAALPDMDGATLAHSIKSDPRIAATKVIMLLAPGQRPAPPAPGDAVLKPVDAYLNKPVKRSQLRELFHAGMNAKPLPTVKRSGMPVAPVSTPLRPAKRGRTHVLIAEDNTVNQKVLIRQLEKIGYKADAVANGLEALEASSKVAYDVILMDCQMPEMDGFMATSQIRRRERAHGTRIPIVALTANALEGDREKCLGSGMDDYLSKPVKLEALQATLEKWTGATRPPAAHAAAAA